MEYMAAQMDRQIEGAISENERLCNENERLRAALKIAEEYLAPRVLGTGGHGETKTLPAIRAALAVG